MVAQTSNQGALILMDSDWNKCLQLWEAGGHVLPDTCLGFNVKQHLYHNDRNDQWMVETCQSWLLQLEQDTTWWTGCCDVNQQWLSGFTSCLSLFYITVVAHKQTSRLSRKHLILSLAATWGPSTNYHWSQVHMCFHWWTAHEPDAWVQPHRPADIQGSSLNSPGQLRTVSACSDRAPKNRRTLTCTQVSESPDFLGTFLGPCRRIYRGTGHPMIWNKDPFRKERPSSSALIQGIRLFKNIIHFLKVNEMFRFI